MSDTIELTKPVPYVDYEPESAVKVDKLHLGIEKLAQQSPVECPLVHRFTPGLYVREIFMPKGALIVSKIHRTEHPYVISKGKVSVWTEGGVLHLSAPHCGITKPGTRRVLYIHEDCVWTTFHPGPWPADTDPERIVAELTVDRPITGSLVDARILGLLKGGATEV